MQTIKSAGLLLFIVLFLSGLVMTCHDRYEPPIDKGYPEVIPDDIYFVIKFIIRHEKILNTYTLDKNPIPFNTNVLIENILSEKVIWYEGGKFKKPMVLKDSEFIEYQKVYSNFFLWDSKKINFQTSDKQTDLISFSVPLFTVDKKIAFVTVQTHSTRTLRSTLRSFAVTTENGKQIAILLPYLNEGIPRLKSSL